MDCVVWAEEFYSRIHMHKHTFDISGKRMRIKFYKYLVVSNASCVLFWRGIYRFQENTIFIMLVDRVRRAAIANSTIAIIAFQCEDAIYDFHSKPQAFRLQCNENHAMHFVISFVFQMFCVRWILWIQNIRRRDVLARPHFIPSNVRAFYL